MCVQIGEIYSCNSLIEQAAGLPFNFPVKNEDLTFQLCNIGGELVSVEGISDSLGQSVDPGLLDEARWYTAEAWISLQRMVAMSWLTVEESSAVLWLATFLSSSACH